MFSNILRTLLTLTFLLLPSGRAVSQMSGGSFSIPADNLTINDTTTLTGGEFSIYDGGEYAAAGTSTSDGFDLRAGFQASLVGTISLSLDKSSITLGTLSLAGVSSDTVVATVTTDSLTGYTVTLAEDGNLRSGALDIDDVGGGGTVTAGTEGYGLRTTGLSGALASDTAINGTITVVSTSTPVSADSTNLIFRAAVGPQSRAGSYGQIITVSATANP